VKRLIHFSTVSIHGEVTSPVLDLNYGGSNLSTYGITKKDGELVLKNSTFQGEILALRLPAVVGRGAKSHWLANVLRKALAGEEIVFDNPESLFNNVVHVSDLCRFIARLLNSEGNGFHGFPLASEEPIKISDVVDRMIEVLNSKSLLRPRIIQRPTFIIDDSFARTNFGYKSMTAIEAVSEYTLSEALQP
jgi:nucleoside-diphosphate-sugar epimerase